MEEKRLFNVSSSPHLRSPKNTTRIMLEVLIALLPTTIVGLYVHRLGGLMVIAASIITAVLAEFIFDKLAGKPSTIKDLSAVVTGLLLALVLPEGVPIYIPILGAIFAIVIVKGIFGGLGKNFMNPALAARCFLLISFSGLMTVYQVDAVSSATPLVDLANGVPVQLSAIMIGTSNGVIGSSALGLIIGGLFLWTVGGITWEIPVSAIAVFTAFIAIFGGQGFSPLYLLTHICAGGILMGAIFMATDPVTSPVTPRGQLIYGAVVGLLAGFFRVKGTAADSVSYSIIIANLLTPLINAYIVPLPYGLRKQKDAGEGGFKLPKAAATLCCITLIAGLALSGIYAATKDAIAEQDLLAQTESYQEVCPEAASFETDDTLSEAITALNGETYGSDFGKATIDSAVVGVDASGNIVGYVISVTSGDGFNGDISLSVGIQPDGTINGISFTTLDETAGMGMRCDESEFKDQFAGVNVSRFTLNKAGGSTADDEIDSVSGASISSSAVVNAVNAALDFFASNVSN